MQKRCAEDRVCGVLRFQAGLACRISRGGRRLKAACLVGREGAAVTNTAAGCLPRELSPEAAKRQS